MSVFFTPISASENAGTTSGAASAVGGAEVVLCTNANASTAYLVTLEQADGTDIGSFVLPGGGIVHVFKGRTDKIFAVNTNVKFTKSTYPRG